MFVALVVVALVMRIIYETKNVATQCRENDIVFEEGKKSVPNKIPISWSYSSFRQWSTCAAQWKYQRVERLPQGPKGAALLRGIKIHENAEHFLKSRTEDLLEPLEPWREHLEELRAKPGLQSELEWCIDIEGNFVDWKDWDRAWLRVKIDAQFVEKGVLHLVDFKSGKVRDSDKEQVGLYAWFAMRQFLEFKKIKAELYYIDQMDIDDTHEFTRKKDLKRLEDQWQRRAEVMLADREWRATPGYYCRFCDYNKAPCEVGQ